MLIVCDPRRGADIIVRLATDPASAAVTGGYFAAKGAEPLECPPNGSGEADQRALWQATAEILSDIRPHRR